MTKGRSEGGRKGGSRIWNRLRMRGIALQNFLKGRRSAVKSSETRVRNCTDILDLEAVAALVVPRKAMPIAHTDECRRQGAFICFALMIYSEAIQGHGELGHGELLGKSPQYWDNDQLVSGNQRIA